MENSIIDKLKEIPAWEELRKAFRIALAEKTQEEINSLDLESITEIIADELSEEAINLVGYLVYLRLIKEWSDEADKDFSYLCRTLH